MALVYKALLLLAIMDMDVIIIIDMEDMHDDGSAAAAGIGPG
jgi:hypothetical protein